MNKDNTGKLLRNRLEELDTLSGGVVYGKEAAWEKLQARMEQPQPRLQFTYRYWLAAAALLVIFAGAIGVYSYRPAKGIAVTATGNNKAVATAGAKPQSRQPVLVTEKSSRQAIFCSTAATPAGTPAVRRHVAALPVSSPLLPAPVMASSSADNGFARSVAVPAPLQQPQPMPVVYINDAERNINPAQPAAAPAPAVGIAAMPVVHILDVEKEAVEQKKMLQDTKTIIGYYPFQRPLFNNYSPEPEAHHRSRNLLKDISNIQN